MTTEQTSALDGVHLGMPEVWLLELVSINGGRLAQKEASKALLMRLLGMAKNMNTVPPPTPPVSTIRLSSQSIRLT